MASERYEKSKEIEAELREDFKKSFLAVVERFPGNGKELQLATMVFSASILGSACLACQGISVSQAAAIEMQEALCATAVAMVKRFKQEQN